jgi:hypothetical protein
MIKFRCWYCNKAYSVADDRTGERLTCTCKQRVKVPRRSGGSSRARTPVEWLVESLVYGGGGALLALALAFFAFPVPTLGNRLWVLAGMTLGGFLLGALGGERAVNWIGRIVRDGEDRRE